MNMTDPILTNPDFLALPEDLDLLSRFRTLDTIPEEEASGWCRAISPRGRSPCWPRTAAWEKPPSGAKLLGALSSGRPTLLEEKSLFPDSQSQPESEKQDTRPPLPIAFFSSEDSVRKKLKKRLRHAGATMMNLITLESSSGALGEIRLGKSGTVRFSPQLPPGSLRAGPHSGLSAQGVNMAARNEIRACLAPLMALGEELGTAFLLVCHTNKRAGAWGRTRLADSADLWDAARSVLMMGAAGDGRVYLSQEKNNYATLQPTILYTFSDSGLLVPSALSQKRDREFQLDTQPPKASKREGCREAILSLLESRGGEMAVRELGRCNGGDGIRLRNVQRAKKDLKADGLLTYSVKGFGRQKEWLIKFHDLRSESDRVS